MKNKVCKLTLQMVDHSHSQKSYPYKDVHLKKNLVLTMEYTQKSYSSKFYFKISVADTHSKINKLAA